jgi:hypothetical protein
LGPLEPTLVAELAWPGQSSYFPQALVHKGDYIVSSRDFADGKNHRYLAIYKADGSLVWGEETDDSYLYSPSQIILNGSNNVFIGHFQPASGDSFLECRDLGGNVKWSKSWPIESDPDAESHIFGIARDGSFYTINWRTYYGGNLYDSLLSITKFHPSGDMAWKYVPESAWNQFPSPDKPVQLASGELVFDTTAPSQANRLLALDDTNGGEAWSCQVNTFYASLAGNSADNAVGPDGLVYSQVKTRPLQYQDDYVITRASPSGEILNTIDEDGGWANYGPIAIGPDGTIYYMVNDGASWYFLEAYDPDGEQLWYFGSAGSFCLDAAGCAYIGNGLSVDPDGQERYFAGDGWDPVPIVDSHGRIITSRGFVYADTAD